MLNEIYGVCTYDHTTTLWSFIGIERWSDALRGEAIWSVVTEFSHHWFLFLLLGILYLGMTGAIGGGFGLKNVFHDDQDWIDHNRDKGPWLYRNSASMMSQVFVALFATLIYGLAHTLGRNDAQGIGSLCDLWPRVGPWIVFSSLAAAALAARYCMTKGPDANAARMRSFLGAILGLIASFALSYIAMSAQALPDILPWTNYKNLPSYILIGIAGAIFVIIYVFFRRVLPCVALVNLLGGFAMFYGFLTTFFDSAHLVGVLILLAILTIFNGGVQKLRDPSGRKQYLKFDFEGIPHEGYFAATAPLPYEKSRYHPDHDPLDLQEEARKQREKAAGLVDPVGALNNWRKRTRPQCWEVCGEQSCTGACGEPKQKLVIVATSGGAYRASFWTGLVLDKLTRMQDDGEIPGFARNVRLITGASGGMVTAAYFAAMMTEDAEHPEPVNDRLEADIIASQGFDEGGEAAAGFPYSTRYPIPRDSLSPVSQQLVQRDILGLFWPSRRPIDRGKVLEWQWRTLDCSFGALAAGEQEGWRPSIVFSPMIVESGTPLMITNLDIAKVLNDPRDGDTSDRAYFFSWFPEAHNTFKVRTAVRMNASFPFVSPSTALPTRPYRRVVDAGYYDNYGIDIAVNYLAHPEIRDWVVANTSGIAIVEIRAFPFKPAFTRVKSLRRALQPVSTPVEGMLSARGSTMTFRNWQSFANLQDTFDMALRERAPEGDHERHEFLRRFTFELNPEIYMEDKTLAAENEKLNPDGVEISMNWYLPRHELKLMDNFLDEEANSKAFEDFTAFWQRQG